jgi:aspartate racemase
MKNDGTAVKTIGLLGGMSWESSIVYEQIINQEVRARLGGVHSASLLIRSYDFAQIERLQAAGDWEQAGQLLAADAARLQDAGAQVLVLATNTMHQVYDQIAAAVSIPFPHIADAAGAAVRAAGLSRVGLLGTRFTMERGFYRDRLETACQLKVLVPAETDRALVHRVIYDELVQGVISDASRRRYLEIIGRLAGQGAEGVIAGCTEIELLVTGDDAPLPYFPTTALHAKAAVDLALARHPG